MDGYVPWVLGVAAATGLGTWACVAGWERWVRRDKEAAERMARLRHVQDRRRERAERRAIEALALSERRHRALAQAGAVALWRAAPDGRITFLECWDRLTGQAPSKHHSGGEEWTDAIIPEHRDRVSAAWARAVGDGIPFEAEYQLQTASGEAHWIRSRAVPVRDEGDAGRISEWVGVVEDIDDRRRSQEAQDVLTREVNHRSRNLLAVVQAIVRMTSRDDPGAFASSILARIGSLGRAHDLLVDREWRGASLREIVVPELAPYQGPDPANPRIRVDGPPVLVSAASVQPLAIAAHQLAVNAVKHGALSEAAGTATLTWAVTASTVEVTWTERGGRPLGTTPARVGTGTRVIDASVRQLSGTIERDWSGAGLTCRIRLPLAQLAALRGDVTPDGSTDRSAQG